MNRREFGKKAAKTALVAGAVTLSGGELLMTTGCSQDELAGLASTLGSAASGLASALGQTTLAADITKYSQQVSAAIAAWTTNSTTQDITEAITLLQTALNEIPATVPYVGLIDIALSAIQGIITWVSSKSAALSAALKSVPKTVRVLTYTGKTPKDARTFKSIWNAQAAKDSRTVPLEIK